MGVSVRGNADPHLHSPCPECGYATRYKQFGPIQCACPAPRKAARAVPVVRSTNPQHLTPSAPPSGPPLRIADRYQSGRPRSVGSNRGY